MRVRRGVTLLEALVALVVVGLAATATLEAFGAGLRGEREGGRQLEAVALAEARLEALALVPRDSLRAWAEPRVEHHPRPLDRYRSRATLRALPDAPALVEARVTIEWRGGGYSLATRFHRPAHAPGER